MAIRNEGDRATGQALAALLKASEQPSVKAYWDPIAAMKAGEDPAEGLEHLGSRVGLVCVRNARRGKQWTDTPLEDGALDWAAHLRQLKAQGFDGPLVLDVRAEPRPKQGLRGRDGAHSADSAGREGIRGAVSPFYPCPTAGLGLFSAKARRAGRIAPRIFSLSYLNSPPMSVTLRDVQHIARLARLRFDEAEQARLAEEMNAILGYMDQLGQLDTEGRRTDGPRARPYERVSARRGARAHHARRGPSPTHRDADSDYFRVPKVIE